MAINIGELATVALRSRTGKLADNVLQNNAILNRLKQRGKVKPFTGGRTILQELAAVENTTANWYSGYEVLDITPVTQFDAAEYSIKQAAVAVSISGLEQLQTSGKEGIIDLLEARIQNAESSLQNLVATGLRSDGTGAGGKQIDGLVKQVADTPTSGIVGGINRANYAFWRNRSFDCSTDGGSTATTTNIQGFMNRLYAQLVRGTDKPDLIISGNYFWSIYMGSLQAQQRFMDSKMAEAGFTAIKFMESDYVLDGGMNSSFSGTTETTGGFGSTSSTDRMYMLNTNYIHFRPHVNRNFVPIEDERFSVNQDAMVKLLGFAGNLTLSSAFLQGVLKN